MDGAAATRCPIVRTSGGDEFWKLGDDFLSGKRDADDAGGGGKHFLRPESQSSGGFPANKFAGSLPRWAGGTVGIAGIDEDGPDAAFRAFKVGAANFDGSGGNTISCKDGGGGGTLADLGEGQIGAAAGLDAGDDGCEGETMGHADFFRRTADWPED
jgi:hypothetical protein